MTKKPADLASSLEKQAALHVIDRTLLADAILSSSMDGIIVTDAQGRIVEFNTEAERIFGWTRAQMAGKFVEDTLLPPKHSEAFRVEMTLVSTAGINATLRTKIEAEALNASGKLFPVKFSITQAGLGQRRFFIVTMRDMSAQKNTVASPYDEDRALLDSIFENFPTELYLRELDGTIVTINKSGAKFYGKTPREMIGMSIGDWDQGKEIEIARMTQEKVLASGKPATQEYHYTLDGRDVVVLSTIFPVKDSEGKIFRIGGVATDVTELHNTRDQLQRALETLHQSEKLAALGQLLAGVAHELNNPLAVVLGRAAILQEKLEGTTHAAPLQKLREAADRCARIVKTFLAMARQTGPRRQMVDIRDLIDSALEMTTYSLRKSNITWNSTPITSEQLIEVDQDQIVQVLINLILNAQQALEDQAGDRKLDLQIATSSDKEWLNIVIADNGPGVPEKVAHRIFDPFFTTKPVGQGTGLGLSVCKSMVEAHGGKLSLETTPGGGATFRILLPTFSDQAVVADQKSTAQSVLPPIGRILIIDDEVEIAAILADCLTSLGIECVIAADGRAGLERVAESAFDAIFCDVSMPGMDGITFYGNLQAKHPTLANRVIFISGDVLHRDWDKFSATVDRPIIEKPFDPQQVREAAMLLLKPQGGQQ